MSGDVFFKTMAFGGFNKDDVLEYIRNQQEQLAQTQKKLEESESQLAAIRKDSGALEAELEKQRSRAEEYFALSEEYAKKIFSLEDEVNSLSDRLNSVEVGCERAKDVEGQIGALVLDALLYSDKIIRSAKSAAKGISTQTLQTIEQAASGVDEIGEDITQISDDFGLVVASLVSKISSLSSNLTTVADKLNAEGERIDEEQFTFGENGEVLLPMLDEKDFGLDVDDADDVTDEDIRNLVDILNCGDEAVHDFNERTTEDAEQFLSTEESSDDSKEPVKMSDDEIDELTRRFLEGAQ